jgi:hypothetical protein
MDIVQNCDSYINMPSSQTYIYIYIYSINLLGSYRRRNVFSVRYGQTYTVEF